MKFKLGQRHQKQVKFTVTNTKETDVNGVKVGVIEGYASTWDLDRGDDIIRAGAFEKTIARHKEDNRPIRMLRQHNDSRLIGGFPIEMVKEDDRGLFVRGEVNLEVQDGAESYALAKQGVLTDMSIGFSFTSIDDFDWEEVNGKRVRVINNVDLWEISMVNEPMNAAAQITAVKAATPYRDLPLASRDRAWDSGQAIARVRAFTGSEDEPSTAYKDAFLWYDAENSEEFGSYKLPFADVIDGRLVAVPRAIFAAAAAMRGARGGVDIPDADRAAVRGHIERYYSKMDLPSPFNSENAFDRTFVEICENISDVEECLKMVGMSAQERRILISTIKGMEVRDELLSDDVDDLDRDDAELKAVSSKLDELNNSFFLEKMEKTLNKLI